MWASDPTVDPQNWRAVCVVLCPEKYPGILKFRCPEVFLLCPGLKYVSEHQNQSNTRPVYHADFNRYKFHQLVHHYTSLQVQSLIRFTNPTDIKYRVQHNKNVSANCKIVTTVSTTDIALCSLQLALWYVFWSRRFSSWTLKWTYI